MESSDERRIRGWLLSGEELLWTGRPCPEDEPTWRGLLGFLLFIPYLAVAGFVVGEARETREPRYEGVGAVSDLTLAMLIAGAAAFMLFGFYGGVLHHLVDYFRSNTSFYGLSDQRVIVETSRSVRFVPLESISTIEVERDDSGRGTIRCRSDVADRLVFRFVDAVFRRDRPFEGPLFRNIADPEHVRALMAGAKAALAGRS